MSQGEYILVGNVGGTNTFLKLLQMTADIKAVPKEIDAKQFKTGEYKSLEDILEKYLADFKDKYPVFASIGIAGPVKNNQVLEFVNFRHWNHCDGNEIAKKLNIKKVTLMNDFVANGYGVQANLILDKDYIVINDKPKEENGNILVIGPGSGVGMTFLTKSENEKYYKINPSEGGHSNFTAKNARLFQFEQFMEKFYQTNKISIEICCDKTSIIGMYKFLYEYENKTVQRDPEIAKLVDAFTVYKDCPDEETIYKLIIKKGLSGECPLSKKVLDMWLEVFGDEVGNKAIFIIPTGGIYICGNIPIDILPLMKKSEIFMKNYAEKETENFQKMLESYPIYLVTNPCLGDIGVAECNRRFLEA